MRESVDASVTFSSRQEDEVVLRAQLTKAIDDDDNAWLGSVEKHQVRSGLFLVSVAPCSKEISSDTHLPLRSRPGRYLVLIKELNAQMTSRTWSPGLQFLNGN